MRIWDPRLGKSSLLAKRARATTIARKVSHERSRVSGSRPRVALASDLPN